MHTDWDIVERGRHARVRQRPTAPDPASLTWLAPAQREVLCHWLQSDAALRRRDGLLKLAGPGELETAEALAAWLLDHGWVQWHERWRSGRWSWEALVWRDLPALRHALGVQGPQQRRHARDAVLRALDDWVQTLPVSDGAQPPHTGVWHHAVQALRATSDLPLATLQLRAQAVQALWDWSQQRRTGTRRDLALLASGSTKGLSAADWRWLAQCFDLEALGVSAFAPLLWLSGCARLGWGDNRSVDLAPLHLLALTLNDVLTVCTVQPSPSRWLLIENRASFERQASQRADDTLLVWMPGRTSPAWQDAMLHLARLAPAPLAVSCDLDPVGLEMALTIGQRWQVIGQPWTPWAMEAPQLDTAAAQPLNDDDRQRLARLLARDDLPAALRTLALQMQHTGRKAEQEAWL